jgi:ubiquinone/menaquinone biosynthesis C-methylase UbiE
MSNKSLKTMVKKNWTDSSQKYSNAVREELHSFKRHVWLDIIRENGGGKKPMRVLDVGTGPGFFAVLLALEGHSVTAIDCTSAMIEEAKKNAALENASIDFRVADTHATGFEDECFDMIVSRNVAWTLIDAEKAYKEWHRILRVEGVLLIFDANWNLRLFQEDVMREYEQSLEDYKQLFHEEAPGYTQEELDYRRSMPMCRRLRPQWDITALEEAGFKNGTLRYRHLAEGV